MLLSPCCLCVYPHTHTGDTDPRCVATHTNLSCFISLPKAHSNHTSGRGSRCGIDVAAPAVWQLWWRGYPLHFIKLPHNSLSTKYSYHIQTCFNDMVKGLSLNLQAKSLAKIGSTVDAEIISKEVCFSLFVKWPACFLWSGGIFHHLGEQRRCHYSLGQTMPPTLHLFLVYNHPF